MSTDHGHSTAPRPWLKPMQARSPHETHRAATPLELLFDLVFVIAVSQAASSLHHGIAEGHIAQSIISFVMLFFAIWWAWMNFTWFASAYDTDDVLYRLAVFVQLIGALIIAVGVPSAFEGHYAIVTIGYLVMRLAGVGQWLRAARSDVLHRTNASRYALGITVVQIGWLILLTLPDTWQIPVFFTLLVAELGVPIWAERTNMTTWHPEHIAERYGLFTIIVLGESILSASIAIQSALQTSDGTGQLATIIVGGLLIVFSMWWLYFDQPVHDLLTPRTSFVWGYGHYFIFGGAAAVGAGIAVAVDYGTHHAEISSFVAGAAVAIPVALYLLSVWILHESPRSTSHTQTFYTPIVALLILLTPLSERAVLLTGLLIAGLLAIKLISKYQLRTPAST